VEDRSGQQSSLKESPVIGGGTPRQVIGAVLAAIILSLVPAAARAAGDADRGHVLAETWCSKCHTIDRGSTARDVAPSFPTIAERGRPDQLRARAFLNAPHPPMPDFNLTRNEIDDIVAYLTRLADQSEGRKSAP
jgi:mono/diheme cytochrome c family protein